MGLRFYVGFMLSVTSVDQKSRNNKGKLAESRLKNFDILEAVKAIFGQDATAR